MTFTFKKILLIVAAILAANIIFGYINEYLFDSNRLTRTLFNIIIVFPILWAIKKAGFLHKLKPNIKSVLFFLISSALIIASFNKLDSVIEESNINVSEFDHLVYLANCLSVGLFEELLFRVFVFYSILKIFEKKKKAILKTILIISMIFSLAHLPHVFYLESYNKLSVINLLVFAFSIGILLQSIYIRFRSFILIVVLHALINYFGMYKSKLFELQSDSAYTIQDFFLSFLLFVVLTLILIFPMSYMLVKKQLKSDQLD